MQSEPRTKKNITPETQEAHLMFRPKESPPLKKTSKPILITTSDPQVPHEVLDVVCGASVLASNVLKDTRESFRNLTGGDMQHYSQLISDSFELAKSRVGDAALALGADAVVTFRTQTVSVAEGAAEVLCYGTAIRYKDGEA